MIKIKLNKTNSFSIKEKIKNFLNSNFWSKKTRFTIIIVLIYILFVVIIFKLIDLQIFQHTNKDKYVQNVVYKETEEEQQRGFIFDRNNNVLARSIKFYTIAIDGNMVVDLDTIKNLLSKYNIYLSQENIKSIEAKKGYIPIQRNVPESTILKINDDISEGRQLAIKEANKIKKEIQKYKKDEDKAAELKAYLKEIKKDKYVCLIKEWKYKRSYQENSLAAHVIGRTNAQGIGTDGIERTCNEQLSGEKIKREQYNINQYGNVYLDSLSEKDIEESKNIVLTIDRKLQFIVEEELKAGFEKTKSKRAVAIVQNPHNGEILAMASLPTFNPNEPVKDAESLRNGAIFFSDEPGSTFKLVILSAVIEENLFNLNSKINCENGYFKYAGKPITDHEKQKTITVQQILERSSNVGTAKLAIKLGEEKFYKYIRDFGFNSLTGIELTGEAKGSLAHIEEWTKRSLPTISFGQEMSATPLQTIGAYSAIANGGTLLKPKIIKSIGNEKYEDTQIVRRVVSEDTAYKIRQALKGVVDNGTGKAAKIKGVSVGGKTGTAQKYDKQKKQYSTKHYMASFCGMIPAMNPEIVILVIYDEPNGDYYASSVTAPVFSKIAQRVTDYLKIKDDPKTKNIGAKK